MRLLDRSKRGVELTDYGHAALKCGIAVFDDLKRGLEEINFIADPTVGSVRVGCSDPEFAGVVSDAIERLSPRHPRIVFHVVRVDQTAPLRDLEIRNVELVITTLDGHPDDDHLDAEVLYSEPIVVAVGLQNPWARRRRVDLADLVDEPWILPSPEGFATVAITEAFRGRGLRPPHPLVVCAADKRIRLLASGRFVTAVPGVMLQSAARRLPIKPLPVSLPGSNRPVGIITLKGRSLSPTAQLFVECVREVAKTLMHQPARGGRARNGNLLPRNTKIS